MSNTFHSLKIKQISPETEEAVSLTFDVPEELGDTFAYTQGQYLTLRFELNGSEERRAYSMCSSPLEEGLTVTVKRLKGGLVSNHINDHLKVGQVVEVMPPEGRFFTPLTADQRKNYYLFGAGSGITPLLSILKTILEAEPMSTVFLLYGNRSENSIIFKDTLEEMTRQYDNQLIVEHILSQPLQQKAKGWGSIFKKATTNWQGKTGRINAQVVHQFLEENPTRAKDSEYFICGPNDMINVVEQTLKEKGIDAQNVHAERFTADEVAEEVVANMGTAGAKVTVELEGQSIQIEVPKGKTILDVLLAQKYEPPYSCTSGSCATCMAKVTKGKTEMEVCYSLDPDEIEEGYILTCQAHPISDKVVVDFDQK